MTGNEIREMFLKFFEERGHRVVRSSSLVPVNDPTLLFTNAGMNQFKDVFLGLEQREYRRATTCQNCVRAGGKHNDLENVGFTNRHHTFFEMLGNFSFGDYFKREAIAYAWELATREWAIPREKLYSTVFGGAEIVPGQVLPADEESIGFWEAVGVAKDRVFAVPGLKENFWAMGDTGPCGPCSEIHYDMGPAASDLGHTDCAFGCDCGRYVEIWNLVFMQFNREASGQLVPLPKPSVDTGAGLERLAALLQGKISNFDTDLLRPLVDYAAELSGKPYGDDKRTNVALRVIADHIRAMTFLVSDGVLPSNEGRGYVLRKIMRRAIDFGRALGLEEPFLYQMSGKVIDVMAEPYPELLESAQRIATVIKQEEEKYAHLVVPALRRFDARVMPRIARATGVTTAGMPEFEQAATITGEDLFFAYDTLGLRPDFIRDVAQHRGWRIAPDAEAVFEAELEKQKEHAKASWKGVSKQAANPIYRRLAETYRTEPDFYYETTARDCRIAAILTREGQVNEVALGAEAEVVLDRTSFYAEAGGQVADVGGLFDSNLSEELAEVRGAYYPVAGLIAHRILAKQPLRVGDRVATVADAERRRRTRRNHTATHLAHAALRNVLGTHVKQAGSLVTPDYLRFDFSHFAALDPDELHEIEQQANEEILRNLELQTDIMALDEALNSGALAFFGDKYPEQNVRVVTIPDPAEACGFFSKELCGGTHVHRTGDIGVFKILGEQSVAAGVRRIEAVTGEEALNLFRKLAALAEGFRNKVHVEEESEARLRQVGPELADFYEKQINERQKRLDALQRKATHSKADELLGQARTVKNVRVVSARVADIDRPAMRQLADDLRQKLGSGVVVLGTAENGKVSLIAAVTRDLTSKLHAGKIIQAVAQQVGGTGGGRADLAEAGGKDTSALEKAIAQVYDLLERML